MMFDDEIGQSCAGIPGLCHAALFLLPEGILIGGWGARSHWEQEPLVRAAVCCLMAPPVRSSGAAPEVSFAEFAFLRRDRVIVVQRGRTDVRLGLAASCTAETNVAFILSATRRAVRGLEASRVGERFGM
jgi:hypothetical protein